MTWQSRRIIYAWLAALAAAAALVFVLSATATPVRAVAESAATGPWMAGTVGNSCGQEAGGFNRWITCAAMTTGTNGAAAAPVGDTILVVGGSQDYAVTSTVQAYDAVSDAWKSMADMPTARSGLGTAELDGLIYAIGGWTTTLISPTEVAEVYDALTDTWQAIASLPAPRGDLAVATVNGKVYAIGGADGYNSVTDTVTAYDPVSETWAYRSSMPTPRSGLATAVVGQSVYAIGGTDGTSATATVEVYHAISDTWEVRAAMPFSRSALAASVVDGKIYVIGGSEGGFYPPSYLDAVHEYDPATDTWRAMAPMPTPRSDLVAVAVGRRIYAMGGSSEDNASETANEVYLPPAAHRTFLPMALRES